MRSIQLKLLNSTLLHPPQSPNFNSTEHLWDEANRELRIAKITSKDELEQKVCEIW